MKSMNLKFLVTSLVLAVTSLYGYASATIKDGTESGVTASSQVKATNSEGSVKEANIIFKSD